jgi:DNA-binding transcriptional LysR family regulator
LPRSRGDLIATVARGDLIATVPRRLALSHAATFGLATVPPPNSLRSFPVQMVWDRRLGADPASEWLSGRIVDATKTLT